MSRETYLRPCWTLSMPQQTAAARQILHKWRMLLRHGILLVSSKTQSRLLMGTADTPFSYRLLKQCVITVQCHFSL